MLHVHYMQSRNASKFHATFHANCQQADGSASVDQVTPERKYIDGVSEYHAETWSPNTARYQCS
jgi:hypothetical protein